MKSRLAPALLCSILLIGTVSYVAAGGPRAVNGLGTPMAWDTAGPVVYHPDPGPLGLLSNAQARALLAEAFAEWAAGPSDITFSEGSLLPFDVDATGFAFTNPAHYQNFYRVNGDGRSPVIFDHDGSIIESIFGIGARFEILGVAGLDTPIAALPTITGASIVINGAFYDGVGLPDSPEDLTLEGLKAAMVHEIGHFINLDHTVLNYELALDDNAGNDIYVPTMFPIAALDEGALATTNPDDELAAQNIYPAGASDRYINGAVSFSGVPFQGANVVVRRNSDPLMQAYSMISGGWFFPCNPGSLCDPCNTACDPANPTEQGAFSADYFPLGTYKVCVEQIDTRFSAANGTFVGPLATPPIIPGPEECFDASESGTSADDPDDADDVSAGSGPFADILLNALPPGASDPFEPNNTLGSGATLADLPGGADTVGGFLAGGDLDVFNVPVTAGQRVRIDLDARELGSTLDAVIGFYDGSNNLVALSDDAVDPDSQGFSTDPALELIAGFTGTGKVVVSSFPDLDQNGVGGVSTGGYWLRVAVVSDTDGDGIPDEQDVCPTDSGDDTDRDGLCFASDNCHSVDNPSQFELTRLNGTLVSGGGVSPDFFTQFQISPDGTRAVYVADQDTDEVLELYSVPVGGGTATKLSGSLVPGGDVGWSVISPNSARVVFHADKDTDGIDEIYSVPIGGGTVTKLNGTLVAGGSFRPTYIFDVVISPDSSRVIYVVDQDTDEVQELYSVPIGGGAVTKLNGTLAPGDVVRTGPIFTPDSATVVYGQTGGSWDLYSVPAAGGSPTLLSTPVSDGVFQYSISADGSRAVYRRFTDTVYSVPIGGGSQTLLSGSLTPGGTIDSFALTKDTSRVIYRADQDTDEVYELYSVPIAGGAVTKLNGVMTPGGDVTSWRADHDSRVTYLADQLSDGTEELFSVPVGGGASTRLSGPLVANGNVIEWRVTQDRVAFVADKETDEVFDLWSAPAAGGASPTKLSGPVPPGQGVSFISDISPDGSLVAYVDNIFDLYGVPIAGGAVTKWSAPAAVGGGIWWGSFSPDGTRIVYLSDQVAVGVAELFSVDTATGADTDSDGVLNGCDNCVDAANTGQDDTDGNGLGDACQTCALGTDPDADSLCGAADNCPTVTNTTQSDFDGDTAGDACDADDDNDGLADAVETDTGTFVSADNTGTDPLDPDSDDDGAADGEEVAAGTNPNSGTSTSASVAFGPQRVISSTVSGVLSVISADVDGDGDLDTLSASDLDNTIAWYRNDGASPPGWTKLVISSTGVGPRSVFSADVDGDGDVDALSALADDQTIAWYENDGAPTPGWTKHDISTSANGPRSVFAVDLNGDGDVDALSASNGSIFWYENDGAPTIGWTQHTLSFDAGQTAHSVFAADVDGDGDVDALSASHTNHTIAWYENDGAPTPGWTKHTITTSATDASSVFAADVDGDGDMDALSASTADDTIAWYESNGATIPVWTRRTISTTADGALSVFAADVDGDGDVDALSASQEDSTIAWYENDGASPPAWTNHTISAAASAARSVFAADVDGDGDMDALSAAFNDSKIAWHENRSIHRNAAFPAQSVIYTGADNAQAVFAADVDGDGDADALSASLGDDELAWYENTNGVFGPQQVISTAGDGVASLFAADVDGDGDTDVLSASIADDEISWYQNSGGGSFSSQQVISNTADGARAVFAADIDGDGDTDALSASLIDNTIAWYENDGTPGGLGDWVEHAISTAADAVRSVFATDVDGDGDMDVLSASSGDDTIAWYESDGTPANGGWTARTISSAADFASSVRAADVDGDGDIDVLSASSNDDKIAWYESDGTPANGGWTARTISTTADLATSVFAADMDGDGDLDILSSSEANDTIAWYESNGASPPVWTERTIANSATILAPASVFAADMDGDGRMDVLSASQHDDKIAWYGNRGGQFTLATAATAPGGILDGATAAVLTIDLTSNGRAGDSDVELATLKLEVTDGSGATLSSDEANALIERLSVYLDNGSGVFEAASDLPVATVETLALSPQVIEFAPGDSRVRVAPGVTKRFFVVVRATLDASTRSPSTFRVVHQTESSSSARDAATGTLLAMQYAANVTTPAILASGDSTSPAVTGVFPADNTVDVSLATSVVLYFSEAVDPASAATGVALYAGGIKVPGRITVSGHAVSIDPESPLLLGTDYLVQVTPALLDRSGNPAVPFDSTFDTTDSAAAADIDAGEIGESAGGATLAGSNADDNSGFAAAALGDVNATLASTGIADLIIGAPNTDAGSIDAGKATLVFGSPGLRSNDGAVLSLTYRTATAGDFVGETVAHAGDLNGDTVADFLIGAPHSDQAGTDAGVVYLVFGDPGLDELVPATLDLGDLASCAVATLCGVKFTGADPNGLAGASLSRAGDVNGDGHDDIVIAAPGASPGGRAQAGRVYLVYGPLAAGTIPLSQVGSTTPGLVFNGETAGDSFGASVSLWPDQTGDGFDDLLIGAPGATALDPLGASISDAGYVYAIQGGERAGHLDDNATPGIIEMSRVASGGSDQVAGMVFIGAMADMNLGRSVTGAVDLDGNGVNDILIAGNGVAFAIPGDDPKTRVGATQTPGTSGGGGLRAGLFSALGDFGAVMYTAGNDDPLTVGAAGDLNNDGYDDFIIGSPLADGAAGVDSGQAYVILGSPAAEAGEQSLGEVGDAIAGFIVEGAEPGDNLGASVGGGADLNADGVDDGLVGAPFADTSPATPPNTGETYVISPLRPEEVVTLTLTHLGGSAVRLEWSVPDLAATYNVYQGLMSALVGAGQVKTSNMTQLACAIATDADLDMLPDHDDATLPPAGNSWFYLVTAGNFQGEGPLGPPSLLPRRVNDLQCP